MDKILLIFLVFAVSAAAFEGFFVKWSFRDSDFQSERFSFKAFFEETAHRPFVHRQLLISVSKNLSEVLPTEIKTVITKKIQENNFLEQKFNEVKIQKNFLFEYYAVYFLSFLCFFLSIFIWRRICIDLTGNLAAGTLAPLAFAIIFPYLETFGGYFYDFSELLFFALATFFAVRGYWLAIIFLTPFAEYNKESFFFFLPTLYFLLKRTLPTKKIIFSLGISILLAGLTYLYVISKFTENAGGLVEYHVIINVVVVIMLIYFVGVYLLCSKKIFPKNRILSEIMFLTLILLPFIICRSEYSFLFSVFNNFGTTYSTIGGEGAFLLHVALILWIIKFSWKFLDESLKNFAKSSLAINAPLIVIFGMVFELRNWSLTYAAFIISIAFYLKNLLTEK